mgnify:FL=1
MPKTLHPGDDKLIFDYLQTFLEQVSFTPAIVKYKRRDQEMNFVCGDQSLSLIQIVFEESVLIEKVKFRSRF